jgi:hypothetical protein
MTEFATFEKNGQNWKLLDIEAQLRSFVESDGKWAQTFMSNLISELKTAKENRQFLPLVYLIKYMLKLIKIEDNEQAMDLVAHCLMGMF